MSSVVDAPPTRSPRVARNDPEVEIQLLGSFQLTAGGRPIDIPLSTQKVVAYLALHRRPTPRSHVAGTLWPLHAEDHAMANLRTALWRLRCRATGVVLSTRAELALCPTVRVDTTRVERLGTQMANYSEVTSAEDVSHLRGCGELLTGWYEDWVLSERERLEYLRLGALECLCERLSSAGRFLEAAEVGLAIVSIDPLRESAQRVLIALELERGNLREAVRRYERYARLLGDELGVSPSPAMEDLLRPLRLPS